MGFRDWLLAPLMKGLGYEEDWPYSAPPTPAGSNWEVIERSYENLKQGVLADYSKIGDPYRVISTVNACVDKSAKNVAQVPIFETGAPEVDRLLRVPTPRQPRFNFWQAVVAGMERHGRSYIVGQGFRRVGDARVPAVMFHVADTNMGYDADEKKFYIGTKANRKAEYLQKDVVVLEYLDAQSPLEASRMEIMLMFYAMQYNVNFFKNGGQLPGFLRKRDSGRAMTPERQQEIEQAFKVRGGQAGDKRRVPVFNDLDYVTIGNNQRDMEFLQLVNMVERRIVKAFGIPYALFDETDTTFSNMAEARQHFWNSKLIPIIRLLEAALDDQVTERWQWPASIRWDIDAIPELRTNVETASESALRYYQMGVPFSAINTRMGLGFDEFEGDDEQFEPMQLSAEKAAEVAMIHRVKEGIAAEKRLNHDETLRRKEAQAVQEAMKANEPGLKKAASDFFKSLYRDVKAKMDEYTTEAKSINESINFDDDAFYRWLETQRWGDGLTESVSEHIQKAYERGHVRAVAAFGLERYFDLDPAKFAAHMANRQMLMVRLADSVKEEIRAVLVKAVEDGADAKVLAQTLSQKFNELERNRATIIANTETAAAYNGGRFDGMRELGIENKEWLHSYSPNERPGHVALDGKRAKMDEPFTNPLTGADLMRPQDPGAPASECVNCQCSVLASLTTEDEEAILQAARDRRPNVEV